MKNHPYQRYKRQETPAVGISEEANIRSLHLGTRTVQSAMNLENPVELVLSYSRAMMAWLLFFEPDAAQRAHITHIGLGGGSMVRWIDHYLPAARQLAVEIDPQVIAIAKSQFALPQEGERLTVVPADGAEYIRVLHGSTDVVLTDAFDGEDIVGDLVGEAFFADCYNALTENGIFVANWWSGDPRYPLYERRLRAVFADNILEIPAATHGNMAVLAFKRRPDIAPAQLKKRAEKYSATTDLDFNALFYAVRNYWAKHAR